jgi:hypothetical protein
VNPDIEFVRGLGERCKLMAGNCEDSANRSIGGAREHNHGRTVAFRHVAKDCAEYVARREKEGGR